MSIFDVLVSEVWSEAREDGGALLADFTPPSSDAARAERALRLPQLERARRALSRHAAAAAHPSRRRADADRVGLALDRGREAAAQGSDVDAVQALSEAVRFARSPSSQELDAREGRAHALVRLQEAEAGLQDLRAVRVLLEAQLTAQPAASAAGTPPGRGPDASHAAFGRYIRTLLAMSSCLELQGDRVQAEATLREAMATVRDSGERVEASAKAEAVNTVVQRLKKMSSAADNGPTKTRPPLVSSGLHALPKLFGGAHPAMPAASAALEERSDARRGRHLVATQNIPAGGALIVERPYAWSLSWEEMATHCLHCCSPVLASEPCPHCSNVVFCGPDCRQAALSSYHLVECSVLRQLVAPRSSESDGSEGGPGSEDRVEGELSAMALLVFRIVVRAAGLGAVQLPPPPPPGLEPQPVLLALPESFVDLYAQGQTNGEEKGRKRKKGKAKDLDGYGPVFAQLTHSESRPPADLLKRSLTAAYLTRCLEASLGAGVVRDGAGGAQDDVVENPVEDTVEDTVDDTVEDAVCRPRLDEAQALLLTTAFLRHLQSCSCNAYQIAEQRLEGGAVRGARAAELGGACYPTVSLANHACAPNVVRHSHANVCVVRALHAIPKGGEVLDNYGPNFLELDVEDRRAALSRQYMFHCECDACRLEWPTLPDLRQLPEAPAAPEHGKGGKKKPHASRLPELADRLQVGLQGLLKGQTEEALQAALKYSSALQQQQQQQQQPQPPCKEQVRADQVTSLCWSLSGNVVRY